MRVTQIIRQKVFVRSLILATGIFLVSLVLGTLVGQTTVEELMRQLGAALQPLESIGDLSILLFVIVFINNAIKALGLIFLGTLLGLPPLLFVGLNGFIVGGLGSALESANGWTYAMASLAPHGVIEIPVILLTAGLSLTVGMEALRWLLRRESRVKSQLSDSLRVYLRWILPGLAIASAIEAFVTPLLIGLASAG